MADSQHVALPIPKKNEPKAPGVDVGLVQTRTLLRGCWAWACRSHAHAAPWPLAGGVTKAEAGGQGKPLSLYERMNQPFICKDSPSSYQFVRNKPSN